MEEILNDNVLGDELEVSFVGYETCDEGFWSVLRLRHDLSHGNKL